MIAVKRSGPGEWMARDSNHPYLSTWGASEDEARARLNHYLLRENLQVSL